MIKLKNIIVLIVVFALSGIWWNLASTVGANGSFELEGEGKGKHPIIAYVGSLSGKGNEIGKALEKGVRHFLAKEASEQGSLPINIRSYDDGGNPGKAVEIARELIKNDRVIAVIGHSANETTLPASKIYAEGGLPMVSPAADDYRIPEGNDWAFSTKMEDTEQGRFIALYTKHVLEAEKVVLIETEPVVTMLKFVRANFIKEGIQLTEINLRDGGSDEEIGNGLVDKVTKSSPDLVYIALQADKTAKLLKRLKDGGYHGPILGTRQIATPYFAKRFSEFPLERQSPGHYTNGVIVPTPFILGIANNQAQSENIAYHGVYGQDMSWPFAFGFDTAGLMTEAIRRIGEENIKKGGREVRKRLQNTLKAMDHVETGVSGITGKIFFNHQGGGGHPPLFATFQNLALVSYLNQFSAPSLQLEHFDPLAHVKKINVDDYVFGLPDIVFTGLRFINLEKVDPNKKTFHAEFDLWFRYHGDFDPANIEFEHVVHDSVKMKVMDQHKRGTVSYKKVRVKGDFYFQLPATDFLQHQIQLEIAFHSADMNRNELIYAVDRSAYNTAKINVPLIEQMRQDESLPESENLILDSAGMFEQTYIKRAFGDPVFIDGSLPFSRFVTTIKAHRIGLSIPRKIGKLLGHNLELALFFGFCILFFVTFLTPAAEMLAGNRLLVRLLLFAGILSGAEILSFTEDADYLALDPDALTLLVKMFESVWYFLIAAIVQAILTLYFWPWVQEKTNRPVPAVARTLISLFIFSVAGALIYSVVFDQTFLGVIAATGAMGVILGFALQDLIHDFFAGIVLNLERPFRLGDWVQFHGEENIEGEVIEVNWRCTSIKDWAGNMIVIPNSQISSDHLTNYSYPQKLKCMKLSIVLEITTDLAHAMDVLKKGGESAVKPNGPVDKVEVVLGDIVEHGIVYEVLIWRDPVTCGANHASTESIKGIIAALNENQLEIAAPLMRMETDDGKPHSMDRLALEEALAGE